MKRRLKEMEDEAAAHREMQAKVEKEMGSVQDPAAAATSQANREEVDSISIFVGNSCGTVNRVTIRSDKYGQPKGYAYVEFLEAEAVQEALLLNESELRGWQLMVTAKRTNIPGMKPYHPRRSNPFMQPRDPYMAPYFFFPYGYGYASRCDSPS
ncbi:hypothetical protein V6N11_037010 [Hibiscus sabdariffa]|uniref:RRM domain-containing protein n=1 Tax=Hibiscus sabdariffa TaxID=183260 RepID=A0ABR2AGS6_9ROSI